eukprot:gene295-1884_t
MGGSLANRWYTHGPDVGLDPERNSGYGIIAEFSSDDDYLVYAKHPDHLRVISESIKPIIAPGGRTAV